MMMPAPRPPMSSAPPGTTAAPQAPPPPGLTNASLVLFIGQFPPDLNDLYVRQVLETCGPIDSWKRVMDPLTRKPKGFGFCHYGALSYTLRAVRLLDGFSIDSKKMKVQVDNAFKSDVQQLNDQMSPMEHEQDELVQRKLQVLYAERSGLHGGKQNSITSWGELAAEDHPPPPPQDQQDEGHSSERTSTTDANANNPNQQNMILSEIEKFRIAQEEKRLDTERKRRQDIQTQLQREKELMILAQQKRETQVEDELQLKKQQEDAEEEDAATLRKRRMSRENDEPKQEQHYKKSRLDAKVVIGFSSSTKDTTGVTDPTSSTTSSSFGHDLEDEEAKPRREFVPIDYTDAEREAEGDHRKKKSLKSTDETSDVKSLIATIPTDKAGLYGYTIKWNQVDEYQVIDRKMQPWICKKICEYLGGEETTMIEFIVSKLKAHVRAEEIESELEMILEQDAETFMKLMWRKLIFESIRAGN